MLDPTPSVPQNLVTGFLNVVKKYEILLEANTAKNNNKLLEDSIAILNYCGPFYAEVTKLTQAIVDPGMVLL